MRCSIRAVRRLRSAISFAPRSARTGASRIMTRRCIAHLPFVVVPPTAPPPREDGGGAPTRLPAPVATVGLDEEAVDRGAVGLGGQPGALERLRQPPLHLVDLCDRLLERALAGADRHH